MVKKKRHTNQGIGKNSALYMAASIFRVHSTNEVRAKIEKYQGFYRENQGKLNKLFDVDFVNANSLVFRDIKKFWARSKEEASTFASMVINTSFGLWTKRRVVFQITPEALEFILSDDPVFGDEVSFHMSTFLNEPIPYMVQFPDGSGFFCAGFTMENEELCDPDSGFSGFQGAPAYYINYVGDESLSGLFHPLGWADLGSVCCGKMSAMIFQNRGGRGDKVVVSGFDPVQQEIAKKVFRTMIYLANIFRLQFSEREIMGMTGSMSGSPWVSLIKVPGMQANWSFAPSVISGGLDVPRYGLHSYFGFLSEGTMRTYARSLPAPDDPASDELFESPENKEEFYVIRNWLNHCTVFTVSEEVEEFCRKRLSKEAIPATLPRDLFSFIPVKELVIWYESDRGISIISLADQDSVYVRDWGDHDDENYSIHTTRLQNDSVAWVWFRSMAVLYHIALYYQRRTEIRNTGIPVSAVKNSGNGAIPASDGPKSRAGYDVSLDGLRLLDVTRRAVKAVSHRERISRYGWKMPTHVRRGHIHRFWVGSGDDRHLEERWVDAMVINRDGEAIVRTHEVKE